jgi:superfamily I DNA/RNA helicase
VVFLVQMNETVMPSWQALKSLLSPEGATEDEQCAQPPPPSRNPTNTKSCRVVLRVACAVCVVRFRRDQHTRALEEERRLCYVAMTRARERLFISFVNNSRYPLGATGRWGGGGWC